MKVRKKRRAWKIYGEGKYYKVRYNTINYEILPFAMRFTRDAVSDWLSERSHSPRPGSETPS